MRYKAETETNYKTFLEKNSLRKPIRKFELKTGMKGTKNLKMETKTGSKVKIISGTC